MPKGAWAQMSSASRVSGWLGYTYPSLGKRVSCCFFQEWPRRRLMTPKKDFSLRENLILWPFFSLCPFLLSHRCPSFNLHRAVLFSPKTQLKGLLGFHLTSELDTFQDEIAVQSMAYRSLFKSLYFTFQK